MTSLGTTSMGRDARRADLSACFRMNRPIPFPANLPATSAVVPNATYPVPGRTHLSRRPFQPRWRPYALRGGWLSRRAVHYSRRDFPVEHRAGDNTSTRRLRHTRQTLCGEEPPRWPALLWRPPRLMSCAMSRPGQTRAGASGSGALEEVDGCRTSWTDGDTTARIWLVM